jgi:hypothetical protein
MKKKSIPKALRMKLWEQQFGDTLNGSCFSCHRNVKVDDFQAGHIIAEANGGKTTLSNLKVLCKPCNTSCGTMDLTSFKEALEDVEKQKRDTQLMPPPALRPAVISNLFNTSQPVPIAFAGANYYDPRQMVLKF